MSLMLRAKVSPMFDIRLNLSTVKSSSASSSFAIVSFCILFLMSGGWQSSIDWRIVSITLAVVQEKMNPMIFAYCILIGVWRIFFWGVVVDWVFFLIWKCFLVFKYLDLLERSGATSGSKVNTMCSDIWYDSWNDRFDMHLKYLYVEVVNVYLFPGFDILIVVGYWVKINCLLI